MQYRIDYAKVIKQSRTILENAEELQNMIRQLDKLEQECRVCWKGDAANAFLQKLTLLRGNMKKTQSQIKNLAFTIQECARRIQQEDEDAERRASALSSGR